MIASLIKNGWHAHGFAWAWFPGHMATQSSGHATQTESTYFSAVTNLP